MSKLTKQPRTGGRAQLLAHIKAQEALVDCMPNWTQGGFQVRRLVA
jgi:hypothetical protein